jgi:hypothetical protein
VEFQLDPAVKGDPNRRLFGFTRRVRHPGLAPLPLSLWNIYQNRHPQVTEMPLHLANAG